MMVPRYLEFRNLSVVIHIVERFLFNWDIMILKRGGRWKGVGEVEAGKKERRKIIYVVSYEITIFKGKNEYWQFHEP